MQKKIVVPVMMQKDARLANVEVDVQLEISCSLQREASPARPPARELIPPLPGRETTPAARPPAREPAGTPAARETVSTQPARDEAAAEVKPRARTRIDSVLSDLLKKTSKR